MVDGCHGAADKEDELLLRYFGGENGGVVVRCRPYDHPFLTVLNGISLAKYIKYWGNGDKSKTTGRFE